MVAKRKHHFPRGQGIKRYIEGAHDAPGASRATPGVEKALLPVAPAICQPAQWAELPPCDLDSLDCIHLEFSKGNVKLAQLKD